MLINKIIVRLSSAKNRTSDEKSMVKNMVRFRGRYRFHGFLTIILIVPKLAIGHSG